MKLSIFKVWVLAVSFVPFGSAVTVAQNQVQGEGVQRNETNQRSALASELIEAYQPPARIAGAHQPRVLVPPALRPEHLEEKYRAAWEELLLSLLTVPCEIRIGRIRVRIFDAFRQMANPESVPVLVKAFRLTTGKEVDQKRIIRTQEQILSFLLLVPPSTNALEAILTCLDLVDERYGGDEPERGSGGRTLRERAFNAMMQPDLPAKPAFRESIERAKKWQALIQAYQNPKLSRKNREFLDKAKAARRLEE